MSGSPRPMRVIWSAMHTGSLDADYFLRVIDRAAGEGVTGVELSGNAIDRYVAYRGIPELAAAVDPLQLSQRQEAMRRMSEHAARRSLRMGVWHHEISGPDQGDLLQLLPGLRAADGLIDLDSPLLYRFITEKVAEFFDLFPAVGELVLTLTETAYPVAHRPFCAVPPAERVRRVLEAICSATEPRGKQLVIRPFSAVREDELHVRDAVLALGASHISLMYKTEPFDWHPFLPDEPLIGSVDRYEVRAETDAGAEYYGQGVFPCCYTQHIERRLAAAAGRGATVAVIRVDRGAHHPGLGHPVNEANIIAPTRAMMAPRASIDAHWQAWLHDRHGVCDPRVRPLLEQTFDVIRHALYIDGHSLSHHLAPTLEHARHIQVFALFEPDVAMGHLAHNWGVLPGRRTPTHRQIIEEKQAAVDLARRIAEEFRELDAAMPPASREAIQESLNRLPWLAEACLAICRVISAHTSDMWRLPQRHVDSFDDEAARLLQLADAVASRYGHAFFRSMPQCLRSIAQGLREERRLEIPLRERIEAQPDLIDYVLCGFAAEGHRLAKRLHSGRTFVHGDRFVRATGAGEAGGVRYHLGAAAFGELSRVVDQPLRLRVTFADDGTGRPGVLRAAGVERPFGDTAFTGLQTLTCDLPPADSLELAVEVYSTTPPPCWISAIELFAIA